MSIISFNFSVAGDKSWLENYREPLQIMPQTVKIPTNDFINSFPSCSTWSESVIHTSYITRPFNSIFNEQGKINTCIYNIEQYIKLCKRIKYKRLLIHLPQTQKEMNEIGNGFGLLKDIFNKEENKNIILVLEIPAFKSGYENDVYEYFKLIVKNYFKLFKYNNVELCFDTAHLYSNGLDGSEMVDLFNATISHKRLIDYCTIIHFNGNLKPKYTSDQHVQIFDKRNKIENTEELINFLKTENKILISENTTKRSDYEKWEEFAKNNNFKIVEKHKQISA